MTLHVNIFTHNYTVTVSSGCVYFCVFLLLYSHKACISLPDFKEFDGIGVDERNRMRFMFAQIPSDFLFPL